MGTRSGWIDPAIIGHVADATGTSTKEMLDVLNKKSGLLGVSGISTDVRTVEEAAAKGNERAGLALDLFCYVLAKAIAGMEALSKNGLRYPFPQYGIQQDVRAGMAVSYPGRAG